jgi:hypothetical protein
MPWGTVLGRAFNGGVDLLGYVEATGTPDSSRESAGLATIAERVTLLSGFAFQPENRVPPLWPGLRAGPAAFSGRGEGRRAGFGGGIPEG